MDTWVSIGLYTEQQKALPCVLLYFASHLQASFLEVRLLELRVNAHVILLTLQSFPPQRLLLLLLSCFSHVQLCATPQTAAHQAPPSLGFSRQEHWSGLPLPSPPQRSHHLAFPPIFYENCFPTALSIECAIKLLDFLSILLRNGVLIRIVFISCNALVQFYCLLVF